MIIAVLAIICLTGITLVLAHENRRLTNLLLSKNPAAVVAAAEKTKKTSRKQESLPATRAAWTNPVEAVGP